MVLEVPPPEVEGQVPRAPHGDEARRVSTGEANAEL